MLKDLILQNRSYRRFHQNHQLQPEQLRKLVDLARLSGSAANLQPLRYIIVTDQKTNSIVFPCLRWAGYLKDWDGPAEGERPSGYIVILGDSQFRRYLQFDAGIAAKTILLGAVEQDLGGCMIAAIDREHLSLELEIPYGYEIIFVIALGRPKERVVIDEINPYEDIKYWRDTEGVHHVPKRKLEDVILRTFD